GEVGSEFVGDGPAGLALTDQAELGPEVERLHLDDDAIDRVVERVAPALDLGGVGEDLFEVAAGAAVRLDGKAPPGEELEDLGLRGGETARRGRTVDVHLEREEAERPRGGDGRIELPEAAGRRVARVGEGRLSGLGAA